MRRIGFEDALYDVYESVGNTWRAIWPVPVFTQALIVEYGTSPTSWDHSLVFREDSFDATTRVRRGRLYDPAPGLTRRQEWTLPHPVHGTLGGMAGGSAGKVERILRIYEQYQPSTSVIGRRLYLGSNNSLWVVLSSERISTGEQLFTLKASSLLGVIPELNLTVIPELGSASVVKTIGTLADAIYRETPGSIVDRARDAAQSCLANWAASTWDEKSLLTVDLGRLINQILERSRPNIPAVTHAANLIRILHARGKENEKTKRNLRSILESDAEFSLNAIAFIINEFGWSLR